jgi:hypothetical protein
MFQRWAPLFLLVLGLLAAAHVIDEAAWWIAVGAAVVVELVVFMIRLDRDASR